MRAPLYGLRAAADYSCVGASCIPSTTAQKAVFANLQLSANTLATLWSFSNVAVDGAIGPATVGLIQNLANYHANTSDATQPAFDLMYDADATAIAQNAAAITSAMDMIVEAAGGEINAGSTDVSTSDGASMQAKIATVTKFSDGEVLGLALGGAAVVGGLLYVVAHHAAPAVTDVLSGLGRMSRRRRRR